MKQTFFFIAFIFSYLYSSAQNIVPNGNFELNSGCPDNYNQINLCNWQSGNLGTPDYYYNCDSVIGWPANFGVPNNWIGAQAAFSGKGYCGIYGYSAIPHNDYHEYLMVSIPALDTSLTYNISMQVSVADSSGYAGMGLGIYFNTFGAFNTVGTIPITPQLDFTSVGLMSNTSTWIRLSGTYKPDSAYTYMLIGVFRDSSHLFLNPIKLAPDFQPFTYFYIDSINVRKKVKAGFTNPNLEDIISICPNPATTQNVQIRFPDPNNQPKSFTIYNIQGQIIQQWDNLPASQNELHPQGLNTGTFFYRLITQNGDVYNGRFVVN